MGRISRLTAVFGVSAALVFAGPAAGQNGSPAGNDFLPSGLWWGLTLGAGGTRLTCDLCEPEREIGPSIDLAVGAYASPAVRVGLEAGAWTHDDGGVRETVYRGGLVALVHPRPSSGFHLVGGIGWTGYRAEDFGIDAPRVSVGVGWDLPLTGGLVVGNNLTLDAGSFGSLENDGVSVARAVGVSTLRLGVFVRRR